MPTCPEIRSSRLARRSPKSRPLEFQKTDRKLCSPGDVSLFGVSAPPLTPVFNPVVESLSTTTQGLRRTSSERAFFWRKEAANLNRLIKSKLQRSLSISLSLSLFLSFYSLLRLCSRRRPRLTVFMESSNYCRCWTSVASRSLRVRSYGSEKGTMVRCFSFASFRYIFAHEIPAADREPVLSKDRRCSMTLHRRNGSRYIPYTFYFDDVQRVRERWLPTGEVEIWIHESPQAVGIGEFSRFYPPVVARFISRRLRIRGQRRFKEPPRNAGFRGTR